MYFAIIIICVPQNPQQIAEMLLVYTETSNRLALATIATNNCSQLAPT